MALRYDATFSSPSEDVEVIEEAEGARVSPARTWRQPDFRGWGSISRTAMRRLEGYRVSRLHLVLRQERCVQERCQG